MTIRNELGVLAMAMLLAGGCGVEGDPSVDVLQQNGICCQYGYPNGTGINIAENPNGNQNYFGISIPNFGQWFMTGFTNLTSSNGAQSVAVVGWTSSGSTNFATPAPGTVVGAWYGGVFYQVLSITGSTDSGIYRLLQNPTYPIVWINDPDFGATPLYGRFLNGVRLTVRLGTTRDTMYQPYDILFSSPLGLPLETPNGTGSAVYGVTMSTRLTNSNDPYKPFCNVAGNNEAAVLYQGSAFDPMTAKRSDSENSVTLTCRSGGIARAMLWGYTTWDTTGKVQPTQQDYHQAAIQMKRAAYNGDGQAFTVSGTLIEKTDSMTPSIWKGDMSKLEALWDQTGALCVNSQNRRHPEMFWSNPNGLKECDSKSMTNLNWLTASALP